MRSLYEIRITGCRVCRVWCNLRHFPSTSEIITKVNAALASNSASTITKLKDQLDQYNNAGGGIDAHGNEI